MRVVSLGSGSSGNAVLIQSGQAAVLIDAGFPLRGLTGRLRRAGVEPTAIQAVLLTHEHSDHASGAVAFALQHGIPLVSDPRTIKAVLRQSAQLLGKDADDVAVERVELGVGKATQVESFQVRSFPISHDAVAPCGYLVATNAWKVCVVTDTGEAQPPMIEAMREAHLLVIEANHDTARLLSGPYPIHLKRRIMSATGHLSNTQTGEALANVLDDGPRWVWLAHLSRTNNTPDLAKTQVREYLRQRGLAHTQLQVIPPEVGPEWDSSALWK